MPTPEQTRDKYRRIAWKHRNEPGKHGLRPYTVAVVTHAWSGDTVGQGTETVTTTAITESGGYPPKVRELSGEQLALAGYDKATWRIGPITPSHSTGGTTLATLTQPSVAAKTEVFLVLTGPGFESGVNTRIVGIATDRALHYTLEVQRVADS